MANPLPDHVEALIVGAGPIGLACAIAAKRRGVDALVVDAGVIADAIVRYPIGMTFFTTPERLEIGNHPLTCSGAKATREEALMYYRGVVRAEDLAVRTHTRLLSAARDEESFRCIVATSAGEQTIRCDRLVLATGYFDHANMLDVPGETLPHVSHWFDEPHRTAGLDVVIVGGKNSAVETALQCHRAGARVTLVYRRAEFKPSLKYWLRPDLENRMRAGEIAGRLGCEVIAITPTHVRIRAGDGREESLPADRVYALTGYHPDFALLHRLGVAFDATGARPQLDEATLESSVPKLHLAGSVGAGRFISEVFIENGRYDGEKIFGDPLSRRLADEKYAAEPRPVGE